jgi:GTP-binding protein HflX
VTADVILNVCDASGMDAKMQLDVTESLLAELGLSHTPVITVYNKCDRLAEPPVITKKNAVAVSANTGYGFERLKQLIEENLPDPQEKMTLKIPYDKSAVVSQIRESGKVISEKFVEDGLIVNALVNKKIAHRVSGYRI